MSGSDDEAYFESDDSAGLDYFEDDDDGIINVSTNKGKAADLSMTFTSLSPDELRAEIDREVAGIVPILGVGADLALIFLLHLRWNREKLIETYLDSAPVLVSEVGYPDEEADAPNDERPVKRLRTSSPEQDDVCGICFDEMPDLSIVPQTKCKHLFCRDCWSSYLTSTIKSTGHCSIRCMAEKCRTVLTEDFIMSIAEDETYERWQDHLRKSFVAATASLRFCPAPSCSQTVRASMRSTSFPSTASCSQGHSFCFGCGMNEGHTPVVCKLAERWMSSQDDSGTIEWLKANTRKCPKCSHNIEKSGGCNRMRCRQCHFQFCWVCLKDWNVHGYNRTICNSFKEPEPTPDMDQAKTNLERWTFHYDRFNNHELSTKLDQDLVEDVEEKMLSLQKNSDLSWIETRFMKNAVDELTRCRRTLKWTYAMAFYLAPGNSKQMFEDLQADLERAVEQLSQLIDEPIVVPGIPQDDRVAMIRDMRNKVTDKMVYVAKRHEILLTDIANGLSDGKWDWSIDVTGIN